MRKVVFLLLLCLGGGVMAQNYTIDIVNMDNALSEKAKDIIKANTPSDNRQYAYKIIQNGDIFIVNCSVAPDNISATEQTIDSRNKMEATILKAINKVKKPTVSAQPQQDATAQPVSQEVAQQIQPTTIAVQPKPQPQQPQVTQVQPAQPNYQPPQAHPYQQPQQTYQQPVAPPAQTYQQPNYNNNYGQPYQAQANGGSYNGIGYTMVQNYTLNDVAAGKATIGGLISFPDGSRGIIYFLDGMGHGLAVSLDQTTAKWQNVKKTKECQDVYQVINESSLSKYCNIGVGYQNTMAIINQLGMGQAPAAEWCTRHGNGWYLPSSGELWNLLMVANYLPQDETQKSFFKRMFEKKKKNYSDGFISVMLQAIGGQPLDDENWYWTSSEEGQETAYNISVSGRNATEEKTYELSVRAVRAF